MDIDLAERKVQGVDPIRGHCNCLPRAAHLAGFLTAFRKQKCPLAAPEDGAMILYCSSMLCGFSGLLNKLSTVFPSRSHSSSIFELKH